MSNEHHLLSKIKTAAKRLKKSIPGKSLMQIQDIAAHAYTGKASFYELQKSCLQPDSPSEFQQLPKVSDGLITSLNLGSSFEPGGRAQAPNWGRLNNATALYVRGGWHYYPEHHYLVLEDTRYSPYGISVKKLRTPKHLLAMILHIQGKRSHRAPNMEGTTSVFEVDNFMMILRDIWRHRYDKEITEFLHDVDGNSELIWAEDKHASVGDGLPRLY